MPISPGVRLVERRPLPLGIVWRFGCEDCAAALMPLADRADMSAALGEALQLGDVRGIRELLDRGADVPADALALIAASARAVPFETVRMLIDRGADVNATGPHGDTLLEIAKRQQDGAVIEGLTRAGARDTAPADRPPSPAPAASVRAAVARSLPLVQRADATFTRASGCVSCHNNSLAAMAVAAAREHRIPVDEEVSRAQLRTIAAYLASNRERALQGLGTPGGLDTAGYVMLGIIAERYPPDTVTEAWAHYLKNLQQADGRWPVQAAARQPLESSTIQTTAAALRALQVYAPASRRAEYRAAVQRATQWLERAEPRSTEDHVFHLVGLHWARGSRTAMNRTARALRNAQRPDGGWAQLPWLSSDAYATGQALTALRESGALSVTAPAYQRGVRFLLETQLADGSWYVRSRARPFQPYFESDFPHGAHQFISAAATGWAVMALAPAAASR